VTATVGVDGLALCRQKRLCYDVLTHCRDHDLDVVRLNAQLAAQLCHGHRASVRLSPAAEEAAAHWSQLVSRVVTLFTVGGAG